MSPRLYGSFTNSVIIAIQLARENTFVKVDLLGMEAITLNAMEYLLEEINEEKDSPRKV